MHFSWLLLTGIATTYYMIILSAVLQSCALASTHSALVILRSTRQTTTFCSYVVRFASINDALKFKDAQVVAAASESAMLAAAVDAAQRSPGRA